MTSKLIAKIRTTDEREKLNEELDLLLESLYREKGAGFESTMFSKIRYWVSEIIKSEVSNNSSEIEIYLKEIISHMGNLKVLSLKLAFEPTDTSIDKFFAFVRKNVGEGIILSFEYDPRLLGGAVITYKGEYRDFSLRRLFENEYKLKEKELLKVVYSR